MSFTNFSPLTNLENLTKTLDTYGVAVLENVFSEDECEHVKKKTFDYLAEHHDIREPDDYLKLEPTKGGIINGYGISLLKEILDMKTDERVENAFKKIWNNEQVTMSLDAINIGPPNIKNKFLKQIYDSPFNFHTDQSSLKKEKCCVQSFINLEHTENDDGCLSVLRYSHNFHTKFFDHFDKETDYDFYQLKPVEYDWFIMNGCDWVKILAPKGSIVFWDSRTIHKGTSPGQNRENKNRWRFVIYTCYTPERLQTNYDTKKKINAYKNNQCTSHWPYEVSVGHKPFDDQKVNKFQDLTMRHKICLGIKDEDLDEPTEIKNLKVK